jgi:hypothetical protein
MVHIGSRCAQRRCPAVSRQILAPIVVIINLRGAEELQPVIGKGAEVREDAAPDFAAFTTGCSSMAVEASRRVINITK